MEPERLVEGGDQLAVEDADTRADALEGDRADLLGVRLGVSLQTLPIGYHSVAGVVGPAGQ